VPAGRTVAAYRKFKHVAIGWSAASAAIVLTADDAGRVTAARIAVSGAPTFPQRLGALEAAVPTLDLTDRAQVDDAIDAGLSTLDWQGDYFASPEYRRRRLAILLRRTLMELGPPLRLPSAA
jgi:carbon-monoxide dehydrogenase medium subunit